ncbi:Peroxide stress-activated histidine kinase mak1 [Paraphaeosphaeria sporulosa]
MSIPQLSASHLIKEYEITWKRLFILDYEGTLSTYGSVKNTVVTNVDKVINILSDILNDKKNAVRVMSGRTVQELELAFNRLPNGNRPIHLQRIKKGCKPGITLENHLGPRLPKVAEGDSLRYRQIVQNLMSNATNFTENGYVRVNAIPQKEDDESYTILTEVVDTGVGVSSASSSALFTPFTQFDNSATKQYKGTGLGLSIRKSLTELMGGTIGFQPNPEGRRSIFGFTAKLTKVTQFTHGDILESE